MAPQRGPPKCGAATWTAATAARRRRGERDGDGEAYGGGGGDDDGGSRAGRRAARGLVLRGAPGPGLLGRGARARVLHAMMDLVQIIFGSSHKVDVLDENFTPDFASLHHDVCEQLQAYVNWKNKTNLRYGG